MLAPTVRKLTRILLAFCMAFVFTGQMEAAAEHCARLALAAEHAAHTAAPVETVAETPDCHDSKPAAKTAHHSSHTKAPSDHCECIAALKICASLPTAEASHSIAPYAWLTAETLPFTSTKPAPGLRPPRA